MQPPLHLKLLRLDPETGLSKAIDGRRALHSSALGMIEDIAVSSTHSAPEGFTSVFRMVFFYFGAAHWQLGSQGTIIDPNRTLLLRPGEEFTDCQVGAEIGRASVLINPSAFLLDEIASLHRKRFPGGFDMLSLPTTISARKLAHQLLNISADDPRGPLARDELMIRTLHAGFEPVETAMLTPAPKLIAQVKEILHAQNSERIQLNDIAQMVGSSPVYLTRLFHRFEGFPIYRYQSLLRLSRALVELRQCDDITELAFALGYSSHSHFTAKFRSAFGLTPSAFRKWGSTRSLSGSLRAFN